jgi:cellulose synthase/poly-beta-1,6-N-acetylglucosamine synthase-like glycosyltransferase
MLTAFSGDHFPHPYAPRWAVERFKAEPTTDIVQGRCIVYNAKATLLASLISVEFDKIYAVSHPGRAVQHGFGLFTGSNGYWRAELLREHGMDVSMLTEDIDSTMRALGKGYRIVHDLNVVSYETAPTQLASFWKQRLRWTQGWTQVSVKYLPLVWKNTAMHGFTQRFGIFSLLFVREASYYLVTQHACLVLGLVVTRFPKSASGLARLLFFQYPVSQWLFIARLVCPANPSH